MTTDLKQLTIGERGQIMRGSATVAQMVVTNGNNKQMVADRALFLESPAMLTVLKEFVRNYDEANPVRMANTHFQACQCIRCTRDRADACITRATGAQS